MIDRPMILLVRVLVTFFTDELADAAASEATFVASFIDISHISFEHMYALYLKFFVSILLF